MPMLTDAVGRNVPLSTPPHRIVSLVPSLTDYLFAVGAGERVVGVTDFCTEPAAQVAGLPRVRGTKNPDRNRILALQPDLVLASKEENRLQDVTALESAGIPVYVTDICSVADAFAQLSDLAHILAVEPDAVPLLHELRAALDGPWELSPGSGKGGPRILAFIWRHPWMAIGAQTYAHDLLLRCGCTNVAAQLAGRYPRASLEAFMQLDPQVILLPDEPYHFTEADLAVFAPFSNRAAVQSQCIYLCDGKLLTWYGPRTVAALRWLQHLLDDDE